MGAQELIQAISTYATPDEIDLVQRAYDFGKNKHEGQFRASEEPYFIHPYEVALLLTQLEADGATIAAGLLHDVLEDTEVTAKEMEKLFGNEVLLLVEGVTKLGKLSFSSKEERQAENFRRMFLAMAKDIRVILIKLCDRLHNMRTLKHLAPKKQHDIAKETLEIFAPLAHRLGIGKIKWELEDWSLRYLNPDEYYRVSQLVAEKREERERYIDEIVGKIRDELESIGVKATVYGRPKHFYSIWSKMMQQRKDFQDLFDITAIRVVVDSVRGCYEVLGTVHAIWRPIPGRFKDYVAMPKPNLYQSLHTAIIGPGGKPVEVQIRTEEMHRIAEYGIAAHWRYKDGGNFNQADRKLNWLRQLLDFQNDLKDADEYLNTVKEDLFADEVFVFSPRGDVIDLPHDATPIDFAYRIHTDVGHRCIGARINGRIAQLDTPLHNGDIVEILTAKNSHPSLDWLGFAVTSGAKNRIRQWYKKERREENIVHGKEALERELGRNGLETLIKGEKLALIATKLSKPSVDELLASIGYGELTVTAVVNRIKSEFVQEISPESLIKPKPQKSSSEGVLVDGSNSMLLHLSKCCSPLPGEPIIGIVTKGRGLSIHINECPNVSRVPLDRHVPVNWSQSETATYPVEIEIEVIDRVGILKDLTIKIADIKTNIRSIKVTRGKEKTAIIAMVLDVVDLNHLQRAISILSRISDVIRATRVARAQKGTRKPVRS
ncbi:MAG TPA: (p)ppGpp synthetase [Cyanobacteria bacterium UBA8530]|nr:(p)ppGpp synthetase [Cyanobacteria bacterium UBA8530]